MLSLVTAGEGAGRIPASGECQREIKGRGVGRERGREVGREREAKRGAGRGAGARITTQEGSAKEIRD